MLGIACLAYRKVVHSSPLPERRPQCNVTEHVVSTLGLHPWSFESLPIHLSNVEVEMLYSYSISKDSGDVVPHFGFCNRPNFTLAHPPFHSNDLNMELTILKILRGITVGELWIK